MRNFQNRIKRISDHLSEQEPDEDGPGGSFLVYDAEYAKAHPEEWAAFREKFFSRFEYRVEYVSVWFMPWINGFVKHWPIEGGDDASLRLFARQDWLEALQDSKQYPGRRMMKPGLWDNHNPVTGR